jgi:hypothetical protein
MEILAENEVSDSGEDTGGGDSEDDESFLEGELTTQWHQSSKLIPEWYTLGKKVMSYVWDMLLQSLLSAHHTWKGLAKNRLRDSSFSMLLLKRNTRPVSIPVPCFSTTIFTIFVFKNYVETTKD